MGAAIPESTSPSSSSGDIEDALQAFNAMYDEAEFAGVVARAEGRWREVEDLRGKGRLRREKEAKEAASAVKAAEVGEGMGVVGSGGVEAGVDA